MGRVAEEYAWCFAWCCEVSGGAWGACLGRAFADLDLRVAVWCVV